MRYAIISDLHANRQAWKAVFTDIRSVGVDEILCLGDVVGYGPAPADVLSEVYAHVHHIVRGNHDSVLCGELEPDSFNDDARHIIEWTKGQVDEKAARFLVGLPLVLQGDGFRCVHGEFTDPPGYQYLIDPEDAAASWQATAEPLLFVGHTHVPQIFVLGHSGVAHVLEPRDFVVDPGKRFIVNVGSVGQPRDGDVRASWVLYDGERRAVFFRKVPFDIDAFRAELAAAALPTQPSRFLDVAAQQEVRPLREMLDFQPPARADRKTQDYRVETLAAALQSARRWRLTGLVAGILLLAAILVALLIFRAWRPTTVAYEATAGAEVSMPPARGAELLTMPEKIGEIARGNRLAAWSVILGDPAAQRAYVETADGEAAFRINSKRGVACAIESLGFQASPGLRFTASAEIKVTELRGGWVALALVEQLPDGSEKLLQQKETKHPDLGHWEKVKFTLDKRTGALTAAGSVRLAIRGQFTGEVLIRRCSLQRCE